MRVLELFSGTGSVSKVCDELGYEVISVDISDKYSTPTFKCSILDFDYRQYQPGHFDIIWASPPCATFSHLQYSWIGRGKTRESINENIQTIGLPLLRKAEEIIDYLQPTYYFIENPQTGRMKEFITRPHYDVDYCKYSNWGYKKRTRIWTNKTNFNNLLCRKDCDNMNDDRTKHKCWIDSGVSNLSLRYRVPPNLIRDLIL
jgi:site-specific DNA-cytosine methylase